MKRLRAYRDYPLAERIRLLPISPDALANLATAAPHLVPNVEAILEMPPGVARRKATEMLLKLVVKQERSVMERLVPIHRLELAKACTELMVKGQLPIPGVPRGGGEK